MASTTPHTITLSGQPFIKNDRKAGGTAITPGMLISDDGTNVTPHATANGNAQALFAVENPFADVTMNSGTAAIDTAYGTADTVFYGAYRPGDQVYAWLVDGGSVNAGDFLVSAGSVGALQAFTGGTALLEVHRVVGKALEDKTASGAAVRLQVEVV